MRSHLTLFLLVLGTLASLHGATLQKHTGTVKVMRLFKTLELREGMDLMDKDMIITGPDGSAQVGLEDKSSLNIGASTRFKLSSLAGEGTASRKVELDLIEGTGLFNVTPLDSKEETFIIRTPTAVAGVRGTRFGVRHVELKGKFVSSVTVIKGRVAVQPIRHGRAGAVGQVTKGVELTAMTQSSVSESGSVQDPQPVSRQEALQMATEAGLIAAPSQESNSTGGADAKAPGTSPEAGAEDSKADDLFEGVDAALIESSSLSSAVKSTFATPVLTNQVQEVIQEIKQTVQETRIQVEERSLRIPKPPEPPTTQEVK